jgi:hypothetical protein
MPSEVTQQLYSVPQTAIILGRSEPSIWRDIAAGRLEVVRFVGSTRVTRTCIERVLAGNALTATRKLKGGAAAKAEAAAARKIERQERLRQTKAEPAAP